MRSIEATPAAEEAWAGLTDFIYKMTVFSHAGANSWYKGANVPGKVRAATERLAVPGLRDPPPSRARTPS